MNQTSSPVSRNVRRLAHLDMPGGGQVTVKGDYAYIGHLNPPNGTTIVDISDPSDPKVVSRVMLDDDETHTHKVRVVGDLMYTNYEQFNRYYFRRGEMVAEYAEELAANLGRAPSDREIVDALPEDLYVGGKKRILTEEDISILRAAHERGYDRGGFRVYDISDKSEPKLIKHQNTHTWGSHRFDVDDKYIYLSSEWEGYIGNIIVIYDISDPAHPQYVSHWGMPGQHLAGGETPTWKADDSRIHHGLRQGDELWVGCLGGGFWVVDLSDIKTPRTLGHYNYHPPFTEPTHTALRVPFLVDGKQVAVVCDESQFHRHGQVHAPLWIFDVSDLSDMKPLSVFTVSELDSPWAAPPAWFGCHQFQEHFSEPLIYAAWFAGGMRVIDFSDPANPEEVGYFIPNPVTGHERPGTNDVDVDERGLVYIIDRYNGFDILEYQRP